MGGPFSILRAVSKILNTIAGAALTIMMLMTVTDVLCRIWGHPIIGTYEIVALLLGVVIGFGIPQVSLDKGHVNMELVMERLPKAGKDVLYTFTRLLCLGLFACLGYNLIHVGAGFQASGEVTATIRLPFYPVAYGVAACCLLECAVFVFEIVRIWRESK